ncbi:hypothetical protein BZA05DRAFT_439181 [Tricharina praecox]|uniref:uncharacterized protein n=1 Tax=Tricharina praecox TaxID=43433 RepID=UPI00221E903C|nr:uncharacterized protein BZA05DRAFT_439181 [Tricharina praecox]KAI5843582.1 hypothetical protein BZA05DRAFT_439181 [Tricharina praecox]
MEPITYHVASQYLVSEGLEGFLEADRMMSRRESCFCAPEHEHEMPHAAAARHQTVPALALRAGLAESDDQPEIPRDVHDHQVGITVEAADPVPSAAGISEAMTAGARAGAPAESCTVLYLGDGAALCQSSREDIQRTKASFGPSSSALSADGCGTAETTVGPPSAIHAIATAGNTLCYVAICGVCYISVGPCISSEIVRAWQAHTLRCQGEESSRGSRSESPPLGRWLDTPSQEDADLDAIASAASSSYGTPPPPPGYVPSPYLSPYPDREADARSSIGGSSGAISGSSVLSSPSSSGMRSVGSRKTLASRRRARRRKPSCTFTHTPVPSHPGDAVADGAPRFTCTFCSRVSFPTVGNWTRHEEVVHLILKKWICAPDGARTRQGNCVYCRCGPCDTAKCEYSCRSRCAEKGEDQRTFARKDHLKQHLMTVHRVRWSSPFNRWFVDTGLPVRSRCGFCGECFDSWAMRKKHVAAEFKNGRKMSQWRGDWGLTPDWARKLDNAVLPELVFAVKVTDDDLAFLECKVVE